MKAHIRYDPPRCEAWVFSSQHAGMENAAMRKFQPDFVAMNGVFDQAGVRLNHDIQAEVNLPVSWMPGELQDTAMAYWFDADMSSEPADTWERAEALVESGQGGNDPYTADSQGHLRGDVTAGDHMSEVNGLQGRLKLSMEASAIGQDDDAVREDVALTGVDGLARRSTSERIQMIRSLLGGLTMDDDEASILDILRASLKAGDFLSVMGGASPFDVANDLHGSEWRTLRIDFLIPYYYGGCSPYEAATLINKCLAGWTTGWQEDMIADILRARSEADRRAIVTMVGDRMEGFGSGYAAGRERIREEVDGLEGILPE